MVYKLLAARVALVAGFRRALRVFRYMIVVAVAVGMWESPQGPRGVGSVESRLLGFPYPGISMACFRAKLANNVKDEKCARVYACKDNADQVTFGSI